MPRQRLRFQKRGFALFQLCQRKSLKIATQYEIVKTHPCEQRGCGNGRSDLLRLRRDGLDLAHAAQTRRCQSAARKCAKTCTIVPQADMKHRTHRLGCVVTPSLDAERENAMLSWNDADRQRDATGLTSTEGGQSKLEPVRRVRLLSSLAHHDSGIRRADSQHLVRGHAFIAFS